MVAILSVEHNEFCKELDARETSDTTIVFPGIQARPHEQFRSVVNSLPGILYGQYSVAGEHSLPRFATLVTGEMRRAVDEGRTVNLVGASLGGMYVPFIMRRWRKDYNHDLTGIGKIVIVDSPFGGETMEGLPNGIVGSAVARVMGLVGRVGPIDNFDVPANKKGSAGELIQDDLDKDAVRKQEFKDSSDHSFRMFAQQVAWMERVARDGSLGQAIRRHMSGLDVTYVACESEANDVVTQPFAKELWAYHLSNPNVVEVPTNHCVFNTQPAIFTKVFNDIFAN